MKANSTLEDGKASLFLTTQWSMVRAAADGSDEHARSCLETLCRIYWRPLYRFARRRGHQPQNAEDLVQGFFASLLGRDGLSEVTPDRGMFRAYLLAALKKHMASEWRRSHREKRGGYQPHLSLDRDSAETGLKLDVADARSPDRLFDQEWARSLLDHALAGLEEEFSKEGKRREFEAMKSYLVMSSQGIAYAKLAGKLGMAEASARVAVHRLRKRYRAKLRQEVAGTLTCESQVEEEMKALFAALSG